MAMGPNANAAATNALAAGSSAIATGSSDIAIGSSASANAGIGASRSALALGNRASALGNGAIAVGDGASAGDPGTAVGTSSSALGVNASAFGFKANAAGTGAVAIGTASLASGLNATAIGPRASAVFEGSTALGADATAVLANQLMLGTKSNLYAMPGLAPDGTFVGSAFQIGAIQAMTVDAQGNLGTSALNLGIDTRSGTVAIGPGASATSVDSTAVGSRSTASAPGASAFGAGASATQTNSTAIGTGAATTRPDQVAIGTSGQSYLLPGLGNGGGFVGQAFQSGSTRAVTVDSQGNLGTSYDLEQGFKGLGAGINAMGAMTAAMSALPTYVGSQDEWGRCGVGGGGSGGIGAGAFGCAIRLGDRVHLNGAMAIGPGINYEAGTTSPVTGRIGVTFPLGIIHKSKPGTVAILSNGESLALAIGERDRQIAALTAQINDLRARIANLSNPVSSSGNSANSAALVLRLQAQVKALSDQLASSRTLSDINGQLMERIQQLEAQMAQVRRSAGLQPSGTAVAPIRVSSLEQRINQQDLLIQSLIDRLKSVTTLTPAPAATPYPQQSALIP